MFDQKKRVLVIVPIVALAAVAGFVMSTAAQSSTVYVAASGSNSSSCGAQSSPCATLTYALANRVSAGGTVLVGPGTYSDSSISLTSSRHTNVTVSATPDVVSGLGTFNRGIPSGNDNRPYFPSARVNIAASGSRVAYLRVRNGSSPRDGAYDGIVGVDTTGVTIDHNELWNGNQGIQVNVKRQVTISENHIHTLGSKTSSEDTHGVAICGNGTAASGWSEAISVINNSIHDAGGDAVQEMTDAYCSGTYQFLIIANNNLYNNQEQGFDSKGTQDLRMYGNDIYGNGEGGIIATNDPVVVEKTRWEIYGNRIHDHNNYAISWAQTRNCSSWQIYNNLIYNNTKSPQYNTPAVQLCGDSNSHFYNNTVVNNTDTSGTNKTGGIKDWGAGANVVNNLFYNNGIGSNDHGAIWNLSGEDSGNPSYNYVYPASCGSGSCKTGSNAKSTCAVSGNCPAFVNLAGADFRLLSSSPAINSGTTLAMASLDLLGLLRIAPYDQGAYEFSGSTPTNAPAAPTSVRIIR